MSAAPTVDDVAERDRRLEHLLADVEAAVGPAIWPRVEALVAELVGMQGRVLHAVLAHARAAAPSATAELDERLASDALVSSVLLLHDLHPVRVEERVARALRALRAEAPSGAPLVLDRIDGGVALLRAAGEGRAPPAAKIARAVEREAPELEGVRVLGETSLVPAARLHRRGPR